MVSLDLEDVNKQLSEKNRISTSQLKLMQQIEPAAR